MDRTELVHWWVLGHPGWLFGLLCLPEVDAHWNGWLSFTPRESPEGGPFPNASLPQVVALSRGPSFRECLVLPQYFFGHDQIFSKCFFLFLETNGQNPLQGE
jgi:hypothetical protein